MTPLPTEFKIQDRTLKLIQRQAGGMIALYELYSPEQFLIGYEVHVIQCRPAEIINGCSYPERECSPPTRNWGTHGWSYLACDLAGAQKRYSKTLRKYPAALHGRRQKAPSTV